MSTTPAADPMAEINYWFRATATGIILAAVVLVTFKIAKIPDGNTATVLAFVMLWAANNAMNQRQATERKKEREAEAKKRDDESYAQKLKLERVAQTLVEQDQKREADARKVEETLRAQGDRSDRKLDEIKRVADGALGKQMKIAADALRVVAERTGDAGHRANADNAEREYRDHEANQAASVVGPGLANSAPIDVRVVELKRKVAAAVLGQAEH